MSKKDNRVLIFDTTLRDGEQAGHKMDPATKLSVARLLAEFGVDVIEAGFPASPCDYFGVSKIPSTFRRPVFLRFSPSKAVCCCWGGASPGEAAASADSRLCSDE